MIDLDKWATDPDADPADEAVAIVADWLPNESEWDTLDRQVEPL